MDKIHEILALYRKRAVTIIDPEGRYNALLFGEPHAWRLKYGKEIQVLYLSNITGLLINEHRRLSIRVKATMGRNDTTRDQ